MLLTLVISTVQLRLVVRECEWASALSGMVAAAGSGCRTGGKEKSMKTQTDGDDFTVYVESGILCLYLTAERLANNLSKYTPK